MKLKGKEVDIIASSAYFKLYLVQSEKSTYCLKSKHLKGLKSSMLIDEKHSLYLACKNVFMQKYNGLKKIDVFMALNTEVILWNQSIDKTYQA